MANPMDDLPDDMPEEIKEKLRELFKDGFPDGVMAGVVEIKLPKKDEVHEDFYPKREVNFNVDFESFIEEHEPQFVPGTYVVELDGRDLKVGIVKSREDIKDEDQIALYDEKIANHERPVEFWHAGCGHTHYGWLEVHEMAIIDEQTYEVIKDTMEFVDADNAMPPEYWEARHLLTSQFNRVILPGSDRPTSCTECGKYTVMMMEAHVVMQACTPMTAEDGTYLMTSIQTVEPRDRLEEDFGSEMFKFGQQKMCILHCYSCGHIAQVDPANVMQVSK